MRLRESARAKIRRKSKISSAPRKPLRYVTTRRRIPARQELEQLARQLEGSDATLSDDQQKRMLTALIDERKRIPMPQMSDSTTPEEYTKAYTEWQADYNERVSAQARNILDTEQMTAYSDYQQWQKEMHEQMVTRRGNRAMRVNATSAWRQRHILGGGADRG